ncbi:TPR-like protein [Dothidotthia symphoricarpi CBS 119687]|uniref:GPI inositol-deacylase n=1 Tax=Dothidotthia symphoricarpi CBS 119687 TaxID=1392245 RepID=A0A6A6ARP0_9PLEO|nr:TPR-like protein [Dothidotthia symphoricarpi CBS 119687]KAF2133614.1 TPR-like protein [Dothidotthia symphoricarpi CBS 119687]
MEPTLVETLCLCVFIFITSAAIVYDQLTKRIPSRLQHGQAPRSGFGLVRADKLSAHNKPARAHGVDIIFVHGLGSNPDTTWGPEDGNWVNVFLPQDIPEPLHKDVRIFFFNYDSYWKRDAVQSRLQSFAERLLEDTISAIRGSEDERTRDLVFVGHSYGGLVVKQALTLAQDDQRLANIFEHTKGILFLGTPHRGSCFSIWGSVAARWLQPLGSNPLLLEEVHFDALPLHDLHRQFVNKTRHRDNLRVINFYEERPTQLLKLWFYQWSEICVPMQSATYDRAESVPLTVDHSGLNKYGSKDANYRLVVTKLLETIKPLALQKQRLYSVPLDAVESYTERQALSAAVADKLRVHHPKAGVPHALAIHGLGGSGKTQLALKYVEDHKHEYSPVLWIDAKDDEAVRSSFERCASELQLQVNPSQARNTNFADSPSVQAVLRWLRSRRNIDDRWLVVVDNADDMTWGIKKVIPKGDQGSIIITSQDSKSWTLVNGGCEELSVGTMEPEEARALLLRHLRLCLDPVPDDVLRDCDEIAERLGCLALAVDLAGAYIGDDDTDPRQALRQYLTNYARHQDHRLQSEYYRGLSASDKTVWTVWDTTLGKIEARYPDLRPGMVLAFLARFRGAAVQDELLRLASVRMSQVREELYDEAVELPGWLDKVLAVDKDGKWDDYCYRESRKALVRYSLLQRVGGEWSGVSMHGLVQWRAKKYEEEQEWDKWHFMAVVAGCAQMRKEEARPQFRRELVAHVPVMDEEYLDKVKVEDEGKRFVWDTVGRVLSDEGWWKEAEELRAKGLEICLRVLGPEHPDTLTSMHNLALTYQSQGRWKEAEELDVQVVEIRTRVLGSKHPKTLGSINNLASTYRNQGRWKEAEELGVQVVEIRTRVLGSEHPKTLGSINNLASTYWRQGQWTKAEELELQVLETKRRVLGPEHPNTLTSINNLASTYSNQGRWKEAEELEVQVVEISIRVLGPEHPGTLISVNNLAYTLKDQDRDDEAVLLMERTVTLRSQVLGPQHPDTLDSQEALREWRLESSSGAED